MSNMAFQRITNESFTKARVFVLRIRVSCAFPTRCTCVMRKRIEFEFTLLVDYIVMVKFTLIFF